MLLHDVVISHCPHIGSAATRTRVLTRSYTVSSLRKFQLDNMQAQRVASWMVIVDIPVIFQYSMNHAALDGYTDVDVIW